MAHIHRFSTIAALFTLLAACTTTPKVDPTPTPTPATCTDAQKNGNETDVDCGGSCGPCAPEKACRSSADCSDKVCDANKCVAASTKDGIKNGTETDIDCGGDSGRKCPAPKACKAAEDCLSALCTDSKCAVSPGDGLKNGDESDVDCGGTTAPKCEAGRRCALPGDCSSNACTGKICQAATNADNVKNLDETDADCGGPNAATARCINGKQCLVAKDCESNACNRQTKLCQAPAINGIQDGAETDIDCGGPGAPACGTGKTCLDPADCASVNCGGVAPKKCVAATAADGIKNGDESDIDCGGANTGAPKCAVAKACNTEADCGTDSCGYNKKCAIARSCAVRHGGDTCGTGEVGNANAVHESCCKTIALNATTSIDKYSITAGRMREFVRRTGGNVRQYIEANPNPALPASLYPLLPTDMNGTYGIRAQVGQTTFYSDRPCPNCGQGCWLGTIAGGGYGHANYYWDEPGQRSFGAEPRAYSQEVYDAKTMNCVTMPMLAAFCAWDGGRLASAAELREAWGPAAYPWGAAPAYNDFNEKMTNWNPWGTTLFSNPPFRYQFPLAINPAQTDQSFAIAAPGRFPRDKSRVLAGGDSAMDLAANIIQVTSEIGGADDAAHGSFPRATWVGGSWEGHWGGAAGWGTYSYNILTKYGKAGGRCVRPR
jgi:hypothetical protein